MGNWANKRYWIIPCILLFSILVGCQSSNRYEALLDVGSMALKEGRYEDAIASFKKGLEEKPNDKKLLNLLLKAQEEKTKKEIAIEEVSKAEEINKASLPHIKIEEKDGAFYLNGVTLLMNKDEIVERWGKPDTSEKPDPNDEYYKPDYDEWLFLSYGDFTLTIYSNQLRVVEYRPENFVFDQEWYKALGDPDNVQENHYTFFTEDQFLNFSGNEPFMQWGERDPKPPSETSVAQGNEQNFHLSSMSPIEFFNRFNQLTDYQIRVEEFDPINDFRDTSKLVGYKYSISNQLEISYSGESLVENVDISQFDPSKPSAEFLHIVHNLILSASPANSGSIVDQLQQNLVSSDNGLFNSSVVYQNGLVYRYLENAMGFFFDIYVEGYEDF